MDFASLVLGPAEAVFGRALTVTPLKSQPNAAAYSARGIYASKPVEIAIEGTDTFHQSHQAELGIKLSEFPVKPRQGDKVTFDLGTFEIFNVTLDGQGGATLILREA